ncbi:hypothetical protein ACFSL4_27405 [Streptomyces caeni]|uniref:Uncharacterized protein n=1 Tax=Streptomyces caeni TaxID=2307231 RepID=A0ABW4IXY9_9ACTN
MAGPDDAALPLPDYDHLPIGGPEGRIRALTADEVETLPTCERAHAGRLPVAAPLSARLGQERAPNRLPATGPACVRR